MLASSLREDAQATVSNKLGHREEREVSRKTIARGMPGETGVTVVTTLVCLFFITHEAAGASSARHSLRPLISGGGKFRQTSRAWRGEIAKPCLANDAVQPRPACGERPETEPTARRAAPPDDKLREVSG